MLSASALSTLILSKTFFLSGFHSYHWNCSYNVQWPPCCQMVCSLSSVFLLSKGKVALVEHFLLFWNAFFTWLHERQSSGYFGFRDSVSLSYFLSLFTLCWFLAFSACPCWFLTCFMLLCPKPWPLVSFSLLFPWWSYLISYLSVLSICWQLQNL